jgi:hypothetical protein
LVVWAAVPVVKGAKAGEAGREDRADRADRAARGEASAAGVEAPGLEAALAVLAPDLAAAPVGPEEAHPVVDLAAVQE